MRKTKQIDITSDFIELVIENERNKRLIKTIDLIFFCTVVLRAGIKNTIKFEV